MAFAPESPPNRSQPRQAPDAVRARSNKPQSTLLARSWWIGLLALLVAAGILLFVKWSQPTEAQVLTGYVTQKGILRDEYRLYYGEPSRMQSSR
jgi:hypothetical protein